MQIKLLARKIGHNIYEKPIGALLMLAFAIVIIILSRLYFSVSADDGQWGQFKNEHDCQLRMSKTGTQRSSWSCNDGKIYYRWRQQR